MSHQLRYSLVSIGVLPVKTPAIGDVVLAVETLNNNKY